MREERLFYRRFGREVFEGTQVKVEGEWLRMPDFKFLRICKDPEEAELMVRELMRWRDEDKEADGTGGLVGH